MGRILHSSRSNPKSQSNSQPDRAFPPSYLPTAILRINTAIRSNVSIDTLIKQKLLRIRARLLAVLQQNASESAALIRGVLATGGLRASDAAVVLRRDAADAEPTGGSWAVMPVCTNL